MSITVQRLAGRDQNSFPQTSVPLQDSGSLFPPYLQGTADIMRDLRRASRRHIHSQGCRGVTIRGYCILQCLCCAAIVLIPGFESLLIIPWVLCHFSNLFRTTFYSLCALFFLRPQVKHTEQHRRKK